VTTGPVAMRVMRVDPTTSVAVPQDAVYYLDYKAGRLLAAVPETRATTRGPSVLGAFAVRDLVADFHPPRGATPRFLMTVGRLGGSGGWAPLYVFETTTGKVATYRVEPAGSSPSGDLAPRFERIEMKRLP